MAVRIRMLVPGAFAALLGLVATGQIAQASLPYAAYTSDYLRVGRLNFIDMPLLPLRATPPKVATRTAAPFVWIDGALPSLEADRFVRTSRDGAGLMVGRSAYEAAPSACTGTVSRGHDAASLVFDSVPERCAGLPAPSSNLSAR